VNYLFSYLFDKTRQVANSDAALELQQDLGRFDASGSQQPSDPKRANTQYKLLD
jgi:hypothetical protein